MTTNTIEKMVLVRLYGKLGKLFGREHRLSVSSVREAIRALCIMVRDWNDGWKPARDVESRTWSLTVKKT